MADDLAIQSPLITAGMLDTIPINTGNAAPGAARDRAAVKAAKDFESVLLHRLLEEMRKTVPDSELLESPGSDQMMSMFYYNLAQDVAQKGGMGLWKQIYKQMKPQGSDPISSANPSGGRKAAVPSTVNGAPVSSRARLGDVPRSTNDTAASLRVRLGKVPPTRRLAGTVLP